MNITYQKVLDYACYNSYYIEEWETDDGYAISVYTSTYTKENYYFDSNKNFLEWEEEDALSWLIDDN